MQVLLAGSLQHGSAGSSSLVSVLVPCILALLLLSGGLAVCIVRHRRLQRSFANFANSHYDRRSGSTTFSGDGLGKLVISFKEKFLLITTLLPL